MEIEPACSGSTIAMKFMAKIIGFTISYAKWAAAGKPMRDPAWTLEIWDTCQKCPHFDPKLWTPFGPGGCKICGCHVSDDIHDSHNKAARPDQFCPDDPPRWTAAVERKE